MNNFHKNFFYLIDKKSIVLSNMAKAISVTRQAINEYKNGKYPNYDNLIKLSLYLEISIDDLLIKDLANDDSLKDQSEN